MIKFDDARALTDEERQRPVRLMYAAFCDLRGLTKQPGRVQQAHDLADTFHNVPLLLYKDCFSISAFLSFLENYQKKYEGQLSIDYMKEWQSLGGAS